jgi:hypothetical protein
VTGMFWWSSDEAHRLETEAQAAGHDLAETLAAARGKQDAEALALIRAAVLRCDRALDAYFAYRAGRPGP